VSSVDISVWLLKHHSTFILPNCYTSNDINEQDMFGSMCSQHVAFYHGVDIKYSIIATVCFIMLTLTKLCNIYWCRNLMAMNLLQLLLPYLETVAFVLCICHSGAVKQPIFFIYYCNQAAVHLQRPLCNGFKWGFDLRSRIWSSHNSGYEEFCLLGPNAL
jgi:hypothetical protein